MRVIIKKLENGIKNVIINDPKTYNSLSFKTINELIKVFKKLDKDKNTKVIILEGAGKGYSAGHNLKEVRGYKNRSNHLKLFNLCSTLMLQIVEGNKPVIAKIHGAAFASFASAWSDHQGICNNLHKRGEFDRAVGLITFIMSELNLIDLP